MSTQLADTNGQAVETSPFSGDREQFNVAVRIATALSQSTVIPTAYQNNIPNVLVAMELANRIGASVLAVMQNCDVIHGRPSLRATFLIGTVNASGRFTPIRFRWGGERGKDSWSCTAVAKDRESGEECVGPEITIALAKAEGWHGKTGSKWKTMPELMLMYRAGAWWTRVYCPELSLGLHTTEEAQDITDIVESRAGRLNEALAALPAQDAPALPPGAATLNEQLRQADPPKEPASVRSALERQLEESREGNRKKAVQAYMDGLGVHKPDLLDDDAARAAWETSVIGRPSTEDYSISDYRRVTDALRE